MSTRNRIRRRLKRVLNTAARPFNWRSGLVVENRRFVVPVLGGARAHHTEQWMVQLIDELLYERQGAFLDVGANLGQTMLKVCAIDPHRSYFGFEPNPTCVAYLQQVIELNRLVNCTVFPVGVAEETGFAKLALYDGETDSSASIVPGFRPREAITRNVAVMSESDLSPLPDEIAVLKIDVEGGELGVVKGLISTIRRTRPHIIAEVLPPRGCSDRLQRQERLEAMLLSEGYQISRVNKCGGRFAGLEQVDAIATDRDMSNVDFVFSPERRPATAGEVRA